MRGVIAGAEVGNYFSGTDKCGTEHRPCIECTKQECKEASDNCDWNQYMCMDKDHSKGIQAFRDKLKKNKRTKTTT